MATIQHDCTALETNVEESNAKIVRDTNQVVNAPNGGVDYTNKDPAAALRVSDKSQALREYLCSTLLEEDNTADDCEATSCGLTWAESSLVRSDDQLRASSQTVVVSERNLRRTKELIFRGGRERQSSERTKEVVFKVQGQHQPAQSLT